MLSDVVGLDRRHLPALHRRDPALGVQHGDADLRACRRRPARPRHRYRPRWRRRWSRCSPRRASTSSNIAARSCIAKSLKARVGPWNSSSSQSSRAEMRKRCGGRMVELGIGAPGQAREIGLVEAACGEGRQQAGGQRRVVERRAWRAARRAAKAGQLSGTNRPPSSARPASSTSSKLRAPGLAAGADIVDHANHPHGRDALRREPARAQGCGADRARLELQADSPR